MKVLLIAYECSPYRGSEWAVGWGRLLQAARVADVTVITGEGNLRDLERASAEGLVPGNAQVHTPQITAMLQEMLRRRGASDYNYAAYREWHRCALRLAQALHAQQGFDVVHQSTVCTFREPGEMWRLGVPLVWGPFGGTQNFPLRMLPLLRPKDAAYECARSVANRLTLRFNPRVRAAARRAAVIVGANSTNTVDSAMAFGRPVERLLETGVAEVGVPCRDRFHARVHAAQAGRRMPPLRLLWSGQLRPRKALPVLLRALRLLRDEVDFELDVLGTGPEMGRWTAEARTLGVQDRVAFRGQLPLADAVAAMDRADVLCFTSLRDTSGNVVLEALAAGVPVVAFNHQGAADMVAEECGVRLAVSGVAAAVDAWAEAIRALAADPLRLLRLSEGATTRARNFLWQANGDRMNAMYRQVVQDAVGATRPGARMPMPEPAW